MADASVDKLIDKYATKFLKLKNIDMKKLMRPIVEQILGTASHSDLFEFIRTHFKGEIAKHASAIVILADIRDKLDLTTQQEMVVEYLMNEISDGLPENANIIDLEMLMGRDPELSGSLIR